MRNVFSMRQIASFKKATGLTLIHLTKVSNLMPCFPRLHTHVALLLNTTFKTFLSGLARLMGHLMWLSTIQTSLMRSIEIKSLLPMRISITKVLTGQMLKTSISWSGIRWKRSLTSKSCMGVWMESCEEAWHTRCRYWINLMQKRLETKSTSSSQNWAALEGRTTSWQGSFLAQHVSHSRSLCSFSFAISQRQTRATTSSQMPT